MNKQEAGIQTNVILVTSTFLRLNLIEKLFSLGASVPEKQKHFSILTQDTSEMPKFSLA